MTIELFSTQDERKTMNKTLTSISTITGNPRSMDQVGMEETEFLLETNDASLLQNANYMYAVELNRYYFINERKSRVNGLWLITANVDPLMSFKAQLANCEGIVARNANIGDYYLQDTKDVCYQNPNIVYKTFQLNGTQPKFDGSSVILTTC